MTITPDTMNKIIGHVKEHPEHAAKLIAALILEGQIQPNADLADAVLDLDGSSDFAWDIFELITTK